MFTQLAQKLAFAACESVFDFASGYQHPEHMAFGAQRSHHDRAKSATRKPGGKRVFQAVDVGLVHQSALHAAFHAVFIDIDYRLFFQHQALREFRTFDAHASHPQHFDHGVENHHTAKIDGQAVLKTADSHLEDTDEILAFGDSTRDMVQQPQMFQLHPDFFFMHDAVGDIAVVGNNRFYSRLMQ